MITPAYERIMRRVNFKGGGSGGDGYDAAYNARMATIAEAQQGMAETYFDFWKSDYKGMEQAQIQANKQLIPSETNLALAQNKAAASLIPGQTSYTQAEIDSAMKLLPGQTNLERAKTNSAMQLLPGQTQLTQAQIDSAMQLLPGQTNLERAKTNSAMQLLPGQTQLTQAQIDSAMQLLPQQTEFQGAQMSDQMTAMSERAPVRAAFYDSAVNGVDIESRANKAAADATQAFMNSDSSMRRNAARMGVNPASGAYGAMANQNALNQAKTVAGASTQARTQAEQENFSRLNTAMGYGG
jgi:hypothetical protein